MGIGIGMGDQGLDRRVGLVFAFFFIFYYYYYFEPWGWRGPGSALG